MNIIFIGMPGSGKTTISYILSKKKNKNYIELDEIIEEKIGITLQEFIDLYGNEALNKTEKKIIIECLKNAKNSVISTPGSMIYYKDIMEYIKNNHLFTVIYLECDLKCILERTDHFKGRGVILDTTKENPFVFMYEERKPLYEQFYHHKIKSNNTIEHVTNKLMDIF